MNNWREPITDRTLQDVKNVDVGSLEYQKGTLNADDLNRIEDNYKYLMAKLRSDAIFIPHRLRNFTETVLEYVQTSMLPEGCVRLEYIESTGTQYINTNFKHNQNTRVVMDVEPTSITANSWLFEGRNSADARDCNHGVLFFYSSTKTWNADYNTVRIDTKVSAIGRLLVDYNKNVCTINGVSVTHTAGTFQSSYPLYLLAANNAGTAGGFLKAKLRPSQIYDNDVLVRNYVPILDPGGIACLYDYANSEYVYSSGADAFIAGPVAEEKFTYELVETKTLYTDWREHNIPWLSEINRIRANYNALVRLFLVWLGLPVLAESNYLDYVEVNNWERIAEVGKMMFENMEKEYRYCGMEESGGDRLL